MEERDIRILTLYKQHYFDDYRVILPCEYSCLGYYDGIDICKAPLDKSSIFKKKTASPVSPIWFGLGESIEKLSGKYSKQNIGILRCSEENFEYANEFWEGKYAKAPYFAVGFVQLKDSLKFKEVCKKLEQMSTDAGNDEGEITQKKYRKIISYGTFDNADIVVLVRSNSLLEAGDVLREIEMSEDISYMHSIMSISEDYLNACKETILPVWENHNCHLDDEISRLTMEIATSGTENILGKMKMLLKRQEEKLGLKGYETISSSYIAGHGSLALNLENTDVKSLLGMLVPFGALTHLNGLYGREVYNIETNICFRENLLSDIKERNVENLPNGEERQTLWCERMIQKYSKKMPGVLEQSAESMYSYYRALLQTLNTLNQYEGFRLSKDIFYLLFPAFQMFDRQLECAVKSNQCYELINSDENPICEFLTAVNSIIYHTVHTDQMFLMVPGYSGTSYSIPIKLCLFYLWLTESLVSLLDQEGYEYTCLLTPEMEACPKTSLIDMKTHPNDRLIRIYVSQRSLYMPRYFMVILTHEIAHYVGADIRHRELRAANMIKTLSWYMAEGILPEEKFSENPFDKERKDFYDFYCKDTRKTIQRKCERFLNCYLQESDNQRKYHAKELENLLLEGCQSFLANDETGIGSIIYEIPENMQDKISPDKLLEYSEKIYNQQCQMTHNRMTLLGSKTMAEIIRKTLQLYKEIFSDISAWLILECDFETFSESFDVSSGIKPDSLLGYDTMRKIRELIIENLFNDEEKVQIKNVGGIEENSIPDHWPEKFEREMYKYQWLGAYLMNYAEVCKESIAARIGEDSMSGLLNEIRDVYQLFCKDEKSCFEIYDKIIRCVRNYTDKIDKKYADCIKQ